MTFSDSRVVQFINDNFVPVWESVSPVRTVTFELGEGRSVKGTISGEIALYFCTPQGHVYDILPALQSPAATLEAMKEAAAFHRGRVLSSEMDRTQKFHLKRMEAIAGTYFDKKEHSPEELELPEPPRRLVRALLKAENGITARDQHISEAIDEATIDLRIMAMSKVAMPMPTGSPLIVVEPGGKDYYRWEIARRFQNLTPWKSEPKGWKALGPPDPPLDQRSPDEWKEELFVHILKQPLDQGQEVTYDSDSLKAIRIIQD
ncbi:hypothetical protein [Roseibacillus persicicus]|uniref:Uncharacterized protein n=1 Tax=Roseibacillus persicicus TaxID=454148 RepID=A0A918WQN9_9BACT|nr:hypothetical protein [Roseibacillus persicicus]GHC67260.1 hypothetical protein GCM10007100_39150 [Roseibacillus persicicus]